MGSQRITSKLSNSGIFTSRNPLTDTTALNKSYTAKLASLTGKIKERFDSLGVNYNFTPQTGGLVSSNPTAIASSYFYHSDHLGSSSLITDGTGALVQHIEYVPFGETFIDERNGSWSTPYLFNGKEKDEETGLHYYGARYYDSRLSVWLSVDPLAEKYPGIGSYVYCANNPVKYLDPDGRKILNYDSDGNYTGTTNNNWWHNFWHGSIGSINGTDGASRKFKFASKDDAQNIINLESKGIKTRLFEISKSQIIKYVNEAGAFSENNKNNKLDFIASQAVAGGSFDFSVGPLLDNYLKFGASGDALEISKVYFLPEGDVVAHNQFNFGNFLYGYGGHNLGLSIEILRIGAHVNSLVNSANNNYTSQLDSHDDQFSIIKGFQYHNIGPKVGFIAIESGCPTYRQGAFLELIKKTSNLLFKRLKQ
jgi:RHS repeat-associated protein